MSLHRPSRDFWHAVAIFLGITGFAFVLAMLLNVGDWIYQNGWTAGHERGLCEGAGGEIVRSHGGWYCSGPDGRVMETP